MFQKIYIHVASTEGTVKFKHVLSRILVYFFIYFFTYSVKKSSDVDVALIIKVVVYHH